MGVIRDRVQLEGILYKEASISLRDIIKGYLNDVESKVLKIERVLNVDELDKACIQEARDLLRELARDLY